jgi:tetratricopeptide (TPR) repeat protein
VRHRRLIFGATAAALTAVALLFGGVFRGSSSSATTPAAAATRLSAPALSAQFATGFSGPTAHTTQGIVAGLQASLRQNPDDVGHLDALGLAYQQRARETGDPAYYTKSQQVLDHALLLLPSDLTATSGLGSLALSRHKFAEALVLGRRAQALSPTTARNYAVIGDALIELGRYHAAFVTYDRLATMQPSLSSYSRVAHALDLLGRTKLAISDMKLAVNASLGQGEAEAWSHVQLGKIYWETGRVAATGAEDRAALRAYPGYPLALDALARVQAAQGHLRAAIVTETDAVNRIPLPQYVSFLGDLDRAAGHQAAARKQYGLISVIDRLLTANGVNSDLEISVFDSDHHISPAATVALASRAFRERPSIDGDDALAWALTRDGRCAAALPHANRSLRLGTKDALKLFHRGMTERCLGLRAAAHRDFEHALALNPNFSVLWSPVAERLAR